MDYDEPHTNSMIVLDIDAENRIHSVRSGSVNGTGFTDEEIRTFFFQKILADDREKIENALRQPDPALFRSYLHTKQGSRIAASVLISPMPGEASTRTIFVIPETKEIPVRTSANGESDLAYRLAAIVNSSDDAIISKSLDGMITSWNKSAEIMFGYTEQESIGKHITMIIPDDRREEEDMIISKIKSGERVDHFETVRVAKDGALRNISLTISPIIDTKGKIIGASKIARDIDFKVKAERQKELYVTRLQELNRYKDDFMIMASHELKTPLTVILANLQIIEQITTDEKTKPLVKKVIDKAFQMSSLIGNLMDVSKIQAGKLNLNKTSYQLHEQVEDVINSLQSTTDKHRILLVTPEKMDSFIYADQEKMRHVFVNLIENAIKYSPDGGDIKVIYKDDDYRISISVSDQGVGILPEDLENIFQRFYRGKIASSFAGSGIGLFISLEVVKEHRGEITVESSEGKGTTFTVTFPK